MGMEEAMEAVVVVVLGEKDAVDTKVVGIEEGSAGEAVIMGMGAVVGRTRADVRIGGISSSPPSRDSSVCLLAWGFLLPASSFTQLYIMQYVLLVNWSSRDLVCMICVCDSLVIDRSTG
jgi:hypothetical protein